MDNVTHTLTGLLVARAVRAGLGRPRGGAALAAAPGPLAVPGRQRRDIFLGRGAAGRGRDAAPSPRETAETPEVVQARESSAVAATFLSFSSFPWLEISETAEGTEISWTDLRFADAGRDTFVARVVLDKNGRVTRESFRF